MKKQVSLRRKLLILIGVTIGLSQALVAGTTIWLEATRYSNAKGEILLSQGRIMAAAVSRGVADKDPSQVYAALRGMGQLKGTYFVKITDDKDRFVAELGEAERLASDLMITPDIPTISPADLLFTRSIEARMPIVQSGKPVGHLVLIVDAQDFKDQLSTTLKCALISLAVSLFIAILIAWGLQRPLTRPVLQLQQAMAKVADDHNYGLMLPPSPLKELDQLIAGFNKMLSQIKQRDDVIARNYVELEQQVADRTADLRIAKDVAETANAQKSDFLATMSHEIRTPMNGMLVMAELLTQSELPSRCQRYAQVIWRSGQSLLAIINDILDLSKIESGKLELEAIALDLPEIVQTTLDLFSERARSKGLDLAARLATDVPTSLTGDPVRLGQVLGNLLNNALKFTERGGVILDIRMKSDDQNELVFSVVDTGIGIAKDKLATVFESFSQADQSTTRRFGGTGLGLTICRQLVRAMGSEITLQSELGVGSTFSFSLHLAHDSRSTITAPVPAAEVLKPVHIATTRTLTCDVLAYYFESAGFAVECHGSLEKVVGGESFLITDAAASTSAALAKLRQQGVVVIDLAEPGAERSSHAQIDATLSWPVSCRDVQDLVKKIKDLSPLDSTIEHAPSAPGIMFSGRRALVADDLDINCEVAKEALSRLGVQVDFVSDGAAAVDAVFSKSYDVVLMDGSMPVMDGIEATRVIRAREREENGHRTPIIALTANVIGTGSKDWFDAGVDGMLHKPFALADLRLTLTKLFGESEPTIRSSEHDVANHELPETSRSAVLIDDTILKDLQGLASAGNSSFLDRVIKLYVDRSPTAAQHIKVHTESGSAPMVAKAAHALKSMSLNIGARQVAGCVAKIELDAKDSKLPSKEVLDQLEDLVARSCAALQTATFSAAA